MSLTSGPAPRDRTDRAYLRGAAGGSAYKLAKISVRLTLMPVHDIRPYLSLRARPPSPTCRYIRFPQAKLIGRGVH